MTSLTNILHCTKTNKMIEKKSNGDYWTRLPELGPVPQENYEKIQEKWDEQKGN